MEIKTVGECFYQIRNGANIKQGAVPGGYPITRIETTANDKFNRDRMGYAGIADLTKYQSYVLEDGDLLMSHINSVQYLGRTVLYEKQEGEAVIHGMNLLSLKANKEIIIPAYARYFFYSPFFREQLSRITKKSVNQASFTVADLKKLKMLVPTLAEQTSIVDILNKVNKLIEKRNDELSSLDELIKARFVEMFGDPMINNKGYPLKRYGDLFELNAGGTPSKSRPEYWENGTISWIGSNMCQNAYIYENDGNYITEEGFRHSSARMFPIDTVLVALVGATIGKTALLKFETTTNQNVLGIRQIRESGYTPEFVYYYTQGLYDKFLAIGDGGFAMASKSFISNLQIPVVDMSNQMEFTSFANQVDKSKAAVQKALDEAQVLFDSLMQEYFG